MQSFYETSEKNSLLPDVFYACVRDCRVEAVNNNFFYEKYFKPTFEDCANKLTSFMPVLDNRPNVA